MLRYLNFPRIPQHLLDQLSRDPNDYQRKVLGLKKPNDLYSTLWTDSNNELINSWCKENICNDMHWAFLFISSDLSIHKDNGTLTKLSYVVDTGGNNVTTNFFDDDMNMTHSYVIEPNRWHILKVDSFHSVTNVDTQRFIVTGRVFP